LALGPTQPPIQWVPGVLSLGAKRPGREADHSPPSSAESKECLHGVAWAYLKAQGQLYFNLDLHDFNTTTIVDAHTSEVGVYHHRNVKFICKTKEMKNESEILYFSVEPSKLN
jgi:hypothetical protein